MLQALRLELGLTALASHFRYLSYRDSLLPAVNEEEVFARTLLCLDSIHIDKDTQKQVFALLAGILHFGNVQFDENVREGQVVGVSAGSTGAFTTAGISPHPYTRMHSYPIETKTYYICKEHCWACRRRICCSHSPSKRCSLAGRLSSRPTIRPRYAINHHYQ